MGRGDGGGGCISPVAAAAKDVAVVPLAIVALDSANIVKQRQNNRKTQEEELLDTA